MHVPQILTIALSKSSRTNTLRFTLKNSTPPVQTAAVIQDTGSSVGFKKLGQRQNQKAKGRRRKSIQEEIVGKKEEEEELCQQESLSDGLTDASIF